MWRSSCFLSSFASFHSRPLPLPLGRLPCALLPSMNDKRSLVVLTASFVLKTWEYRPRRDLYILYSYILLNTSRYIGIYTYIFIKSGEQLNKTTWKHDQASLRLLLNRHDVDEMYLDFYSTISDSQITICNTKQHYAVAYTELLSWENVEEQRTFRKAGSGTEDWIYISMSDMKQHVRLVSACASKCACVCTLRRVCVCVCVCVRG